MKSFRSLPTSFNSMWNMQHDLSLLVRRRFWRRHHRRTEFERRAAQDNARQEDRTRAKPGGRRHNAQRDYLLHMDAESRGDRSFEQVVVRTIAWCCGIGGAADAGRSMTRRVFSTVLGPCSRHSPTMRPFSLYSILMGAASAAARRLASSASASSPSAR